MSESNSTWKPPIPVGDDVLKCRWCEWTCPVLYRNVTDKPTVEPRDGYVRLTAHSKSAHGQEYYRMLRRKFTANA